MEMNQTAKGFRKTIYHRGDYFHHKKLSAYQTRPKSRQRSIESTFGVSKKESLEEIQMINPKMKIPERSRPQTVNAPPMI